MSEPLDLSKLRALFAEATPGPWKACRCGLCGLVRTSPEGEPVLTTCVDGEPARPRDAALIVALHSNGPALLDEVERLRAELAHAERIGAVTATAVRMHEGTFASLFARCDVLGRREGEPVMAFVERLVEQLYLARASAAQHQGETALAEQRLNNMTLREENARARIVELKSHVAEAREQGHREALGALNLAYDALPEGVSKRELLEAARRELEAAR